MLVLVQAYITLLRTRGLAPQVIDNAVQVAKNISFRRQLDSLEISRESTFMLKGTPKKTVFLTAHWDFPELTSDSFLEWVLRFISPNNIRVILATPAQWENPMMAGEGWKTLPKYDIKYTVGSLNTRISGFPRQPFQATDVGDIELQLPQTNPFVPWDLKVLAGFDEITTVRLDSQIECARIDLSIWYRVTSSGVACFLSIAKTISLRIRVYAYLL